MTRSRGIQKEKLRQATTALLIDRVGKTVDGIVSAAKWLGIAYFGYLTATHLAGTTTTFNSIINWAVDVKLSTYLGWATAGVTFVAWRREKRLRLKEVSQLSPYGKTLEKLLDSKRSSSGLGPDGLPRKLPPAQGEKQ